MLRTGDKVIPGLTLETFLGRGEFGEVWKARAPGGAYLALKFVDLGVQQGQKEFRSVQRIKSIRHPNLVPTYGMWLLDVRMEVIEEVDFATVYDGDGSPVRGTLIGEKVNANSTDAAKMLVIATALCDKNLWQCMHECRERKLPGIPPRDLLNYLADAAKAIDFLNTPRHELNGVLSAVHHCDIKPANIMLVGDAAVVGDFGVARVLGIHGTARSTTIGGSVAYAAPEIFENRTHSSTDQYSLAISYYELRTGLLPFEESSVGHVIRTKTSGRLTFGAVSRAEQKVLKKATSVDPNKRYHSSSELIAELRKALEKRRTWIPSFVLQGALAAAVVVLLAALIYPQRAAIKDMLVNLTSKKEIPVVQPDQQPETSAPQQELPATNDPPHNDQSDQASKPEESEVEKQTEASTTVDNAEPPAVPDEQAAKEADPAPKEVETASVTPPIENTSASTASNTPIEDAPPVESPYDSSVEQPPITTQANEAPVDHSATVALDKPDDIPLNPTRQPEPPTEPKPTPSLKADLAQIQGLLTADQLVELRNTWLTRLGAGELLLDPLRPEGISFDEPKTVRASTILYDSTEHSVLRAFGNRIHILSLVESDSSRWVDTPCASPIRHLVKLSDGLFAIDAQNHYWHISLTSADESTTDAANQIDISGTSRCVIPASHRNPIILLQDAKTNQSESPFAVFHVNPNGRLVKRVKKEKLVSSQSLPAAKCDATGARMLLWDDGSASNASRLLKLLQIDRDKSIDLSSSPLGALSSIDDVLFLKDHDSMLLTGVAKDSSEAHVYSCNTTSTIEVKQLQSEFGTPGPMGSDSATGYIMVRPNVLTQCICPHNEWIERDISYYDDQDNVHPIENAKLTSFVVAPHRWLLHVTSDSKLLAMKLYDEDQTDAPSAPDGFELKWEPPQAPVYVMHILAGRLIVVDRSGAFNWYNLNEIVAAAELRLSAGKAVQ